MICTRRGSTWNGRSSPFWSKIWCVCAIWQRGKTKRERESEQSCNYVFDLCEIVTSNKVCLLPNRWQIDVKVYWRIKHRSSPLCCFECDFHRQTCHICHNLSYTCHIYVTTLTNFAEHSVLDGGIRYTFLARLAEQIFAIGKLQRDNVK